MRGNQRSQFHNLKNTSDTIVLSDTMVLCIALVYVDIVNQVCLLERRVTNNYLKNQKKIKKKNSFQPFEITIYWLAIEAQQQKKFC